MKGIYKITSPTGKIYIGQSINLKKRLKMYEGHHCKKQRKLHASLEKYGFENHAFDILEKCAEKHLNEREIYWINHYKTFDSDYGMNLCSGGRNCRVSKETKLKISKSNKGKKRPDLAERNRSNKGKPNGRKGISNEAMKGKKHNPETIAKMKEAALKRGERSEETRAKMSDSAKKKVLSKEHKDKLKSWFKSGKARRKKVIDISSGKIYNSAKKACETTDYKYDYFKSMMNGNSKNKTTFKYL